MDSPLTNLEEWDGLSEAECEHVARGLGGAAFELVRVTRCAQGDASRFVASFRHRDGAEFALVPGGPVTLGLDPTRLPNLDAAGEQSWSASMAEFGFPAFEEHVKEVMLPTRTVILAPLLVETDARGVADASYHGGRLATDAPDSPHLLAPKMKSRVYVAGAIEDASFPDDMKQRLEDALTQARIDHVIETYPCKHGWVLPDFPVYDAAGEERHWKSLGALLESTLHKS